MKLSRIKIKIDNFKDMKSTFNLSAMPCYFLSSLKKLKKKRDKVFHFPFSKSSIFFGKKVLAVFDMNWKNFPFLLPPYFFSHVHTSSVFLSVIQKFLLFYSSKRMVTNVL